ncbi:MAG: chemotaxis protein CheW [Frankiales bacterium]|nr:chemotaxis protein CheW [Frankiales bacterium]
MERLQFRPDRTAVLAVGVFFIGALYLALSGPWFSPLLLVPVGCLVWTLRARVVADGDGLLVCNGFGTRRVRWDEVDAFEVRRRRPVVLHRTDGGTTVLTALPRQDVRRLAAAGQP